MTWLDLFLFFFHSPIQRVIIWVGWLRLVSWTKGDLDVQHWSERIQKAGPKFLRSGTELMLNIYLHMFRSPPIIASISFRTWSRHTWHKNILKFRLRTVTGYHTGFVLHPRMSGKQYTTKINATDLFFQPWIIQGWALTSFLSLKMPWIGALCYWKWIHINFIF